MRQFKFFFTALSFMTRIVPGAAVSLEELGAAAVYFPVTGATLGALLVLPPLLGFGAGHPLIQAWVYALLSAFLTRALHLDGLADVLDAAGSGKEGAEFHAVLKDSRLGAFGALGLVLALVGEIVMAAACFEKQLFGLLFFAPLHGRCLPIFLSRLTPAHPEAALGKIFASTPIRRGLCAAAGLSLIAGLLCMPKTYLLFSFILSGLLMLFTIRLASRAGGYNGDFLGFLICGGELCVLAAVVLT
ncbi:MAG: adenosylcobinamide-GDP ribazoletransferase [Desulfovibrio sp.]|jgi:adenosylcobinamide-GDP ribazoletransferase|nr:adenosylcobinamide-GDP ribazoletransferase [Desulfovibrio sp.]